MLKKVLTVLAVLLIVSMVASQVVAYVDFIPRRIPPIVTTNWLKYNLHRGDLVVLDIRSPDAYNAGHIPGAINVPEQMWYANPPLGEALPWMELPSDEALFKLIGDAGIKRDSLVVVVGSTSGPMPPAVPFPLAYFAVAGITRVAVTLLYAGVRNVALLDGGYDKWVYEGKPISKDPVTPTPVKYDGKVKKDMFVSMDYVKEKIGKSIIIDARDPEVYNCEILEPWTKYKGHIPTAKNLPTPSLWNVKTDASGNVVYITYKHLYWLWIMSSRFVGWDTSKEIIVYCGVGGYASTTYFVLGEMFGYNVKFYDGSAQEWTGAGMPVEC